MNYEIQQITSDTAGLMKVMLDMFGEAFNEIETYTSNQPENVYFNQLLSSDHFIALVALSGSKVIGGLTAYELRKFEQPRSEIYIYDLAVLEQFRCQGVATALIDRLKKIAAQREAYVIFVQADYGDEQAISLYTKLGVREDVLHFDILVDSEQGDA